MFHTYLFCTELYYFKSIACTLIYFQMARFHFYLVLVFSAVCSFASSIRFCYVSYGDGMNIGIHKIDASLCTHITVSGLSPDFSNSSFPSRNATSIKLDWYRAELATYASVLRKLRAENPELKVMATSGAVTGGLKKFLKPVDVAYYDLFAKALVEFADREALDGIDLDYEFPELVAKEFSLFASRVRLAFNANGSKRMKKPLLLTLASAAVEFILLQSYEPAELAKSFDYINIMGYGMFEYSTLNFTAHQSGLYSFTDVPYIANLNVDWAVKWFTSNGFPAEKLTIGLPSYFASWRLFQSEVHGLLSPAKGNGVPGTGAGMAQICPLISNSPVQHNATLYYDNRAKAQYLVYDGDMWGSFDWQLALRAKCRYIRENRLAGVMVFSLASDYDPTHTCKDLVYTPPRRDRRKVRWSKILDETEVMQMAQERKPAKLSDFPVHEFMHACLAGVA